MNIALVAMMGLPSSGKSTLCSEILKQNYQFNEPTKILQFSYDKFVPISVQRHYSSAQEGGSDCCEDRLTLAKVLRCRFLRTIEYVVCKLKSMEFDAFNNEVMKELDDLLELNFNWKEETRLDIPLESFGSHFYSMVESIQFREYKNCILLIDDNNYYHSMRNEIYQIAKKFKTGFCILYPTASIQQCMERNSNRDDTNRIPEIVIHTMSTKLEEPDPMKNTCDVFCLQIQDVQDVRIHSEIQATLESTLLNPIDIEVEDRSEEIERERRICAENEIHQADQILRKWIHTSTITSKLGGTSQNKESLRKLSQNLLEKKNEIINGLRNGNITVQSEVSDFLGFQKEILKLANSQS